MKRLDDGKTSLVEFLSSIKFAQQNEAPHSSAECTAHFAHFDQRARSGRQSNAEDTQVIRSAN